jgi:NAD(P)-dependent dehydrogenase (short-subunit alcohol dehydrogenase family)
VLAGRSFLVTGASRGIGRQVALAAATQGARVVASGRDSKRLDALVAAAAEQGGQVTSWPADLTESGAIARLATDTGVPDVVVNCAAAPLRRVALLSDRSDEVFREQMRTNLGLPLALLRSFGPAMAARRHGVFVFVSSVAANMPQPLLAAYSASKAAMDSLMRTAALELGPDQVRCNSVAPGLVDTERTHALIESSPIGELQRQATPLLRLALPDDVAQVILWLASDQARFVTGQVITVDGGNTAGRFRGPVA